MTSRTLLLSAALAAGLVGLAGLPAVALAAAGDGWGASWSFGPVHPTTSNHIIYTKTTLVPGRLPPWSSPTGPLFLWPGLSNPTSDLVQTTADAWGDNASACGAKTGQWCLEASVFGSFGQRSGPSVAVDPDDHITIEYKLGSDNNTWTQTVTSMKLGKVVSTLTSTSGLMLGGGFGFATEADANSYTIDTQYYLCTEIHLAAADPQFGATGSGAAGAMDGATGMGSGRGTIKNLHTPDSGLTWLADLITLPAMTPQGTQTPVPTYDCTSSGTGGIGGSTGSGGATGTAGAGGKGGSGGAGGRGTGGAASGGTNGSGGSGSGRGGAGGAASGGTTGSGGSGTGGHTGGTSGTGGAASGGSNGSGGSGSGSGGSGSGGQVTATGGKGGSGTGGDGTGGSANGSGGNGTGGAGEGGSGSGGAAGTSGEANGSGCSCDVPRNGRASTGGPLLLLGFLVLGLSRRRRNA